MQNTFKNFQWSLLLQFPKYCKTRKMSTAHGRWTYPVDGTEQQMLCIENMNLKKLIQQHSRYVQMFTVQSLVIYFWL